MRKKVFVKVKDPLLNYHTVRNNVWRIVETHPNGFVVEASQFQIEMLRQLGFEVLEDVSEENEVKGG
jgi:hypothetical protein